MEWYHNLSELIGSFDAPVAIDPGRLPGIKERPHRAEWSLPGQENWYWSSLSDHGSTTSASPVSQWMSGLEPGGDDYRAVVSRVYEAVQLPGEASDYHFALLNAYSTLWSMRRTAPEVTRSVEELCRLDIRLCEASPETVRIDGDQRKFLRVPAFDYLVNIYRAEGFLAEAVEVAEISSRFEQDIPIDELHQRLDTLETEGA